MVRLLFCYGGDMLIEILKDLIQTPETPNPWEPQDTEVYMRRKNNETIRH